MKHPFRSIASPKADDTSGWRFLDKFGREIGLGDVLLMAGGEIKSPEFQVFAIRPDLAPEARRGVLEVQLILKMRIKVEADKSTGSVYRVLGNAELPPDERVPGGVGSAVDPEPPREVSPT